MEREHKKALVVSQNMKEQLRLLENKIQEARRKKVIFFARKDSMRDQRAILNSTEKFARISKQTNPILAPKTFDDQSALESIEDEVLTLEREAKAINEVFSLEPSLQVRFEESKKQEKIEKILHEVNWCS